MVLENGYVMETTFYMDFSIADKFGVNAIKDTYKRAFKNWKNDVTYLAELVVTLNRKCWYWHDKGNDEYCSLYSRLYYEADGYAKDNLKGEDFKKYWEITD